MNINRLGLSRVTGMKASFNSVGRLADSYIANAYVRIPVLAVQHYHKSQSLAYVRLLINGCIEKSHRTVFYVCVPSDYIP